MLCIVHKKRRSRARVAFWEEVFFSKQITGEVWGAKQINSLFKKQVPHSHVSPMEGFIETEHHPFFLVKPCRRSLSFHPLLPLRWRLPAIHFYSYHRISFVECYPGVTGSWDLWRILREFFRDPQQWDPLMGSFPYHSHIFRDSYGSGMGIVWEASHCWGSHCWGSLESPLKYGRIVESHAVPQLFGGTFCMYWHRARWRKQPWSLTWRAPKWWLVKGIDTFHTSPIFGIHVSLRGCNNLSFFWCVFWFLLRMNLKKI